MKTEMNGVNGGTARLRYGQAALLACTALVTVLPARSLAQEAANTGR